LDTSVLGRYRKGAAVWSHGDGDLAVPLSFPLARAPAFELLLDVILPLLVAAENRYSFLVMSGDELLPVRSKIERPVGAEDRVLALGVFKIPTIILLVTVKQVRSE
jgi:hypothetical protein